MPEELLDAVNAEECETEAWEVSMPHPLEKWHRALEESRVSHASRKLATADKQQFIKAKLRSRVVYDPRTESLRLEAPPVREKESPQDLEKKFRRLADQWREETFFSSSITSNLSHPAYLRIMAMGEKALPLILRELKERGGHWFMALRYIVDETDNPVPPEHNGKIKLMTEDWLEWGRRNRYL